jgi:DNA repair exonuclease SbcCD ATPase subunit
MSEKVQVITAKTIKGNGGKWIEPGTEIYVSAEEAKKGKETGRYVSEKDEKATKSTGEFEKKAADLQAELDALKEAVKSIDATAGAKEVKDAVTALQEKINA